MAMDEKQLSILLPVYNWDIGLLLRALSAEIDTAGLAHRVEILIGDDCSSPHFQEINREHVRALSAVGYYEQEQNIGRAALRNELIGRARGTYILLLDADVVPDSDHFLRTYLDCITRQQLVVCGGISYRQRSLLDRKYDFYLHKGKKTEWIPARQRQQVPWRYFFSANVLLHAEVLRNHGLDESFTGYGYEDIEWGIRLDREYGILHIDNTCSHLGLVEKQLAFDRMRSSIDNFIELKRMHPEVFNKTGVSLFTTCLSHLPRPVLRALDTVLARAFRHIPFSRIAYLCFQLDKAVLFSLRDRKTAARGRCRG